MVVDRAHATGEEDDASELRQDTRHFVRLVLV